MQSNIKKEEENQKHKKAQCIIACQSNKRSPRKTHDS